MSSDRPGLARTVICIVVIVPAVAFAAAGQWSRVEAERRPTISITIDADGAQRALETDRLTIGEALQEAGIELGPQDRVTPALSLRLCEGICVKVVRVREAMQTVSEPVQFETIRTFTRSLRPGQVQVTQQGSYGERLGRYVVRYEDGTEISRTLMSSEVVREPVARTEKIGSACRYTSRGEFRTRKVLKMQASAYDPGPRSCGKYASGRTACGMKAGYGVVAVDPKVIPLRTELYIEGYGFAIAGDTGGAIKGNRIDLGYDTYREAIKFGRKTVIVHVLQE